MAGTTGTAGRGGTTGTAGRGGTTGTAGAGGTTSCVPLTAKPVQVGRMSASAAGPWSCGYPSNLNTAPISTRVGANTYYGTVNGIDYATAAECGRCIELTRTFTNGNPTTMITFTVVGQCGAAENCSTAAFTNQYMLSDQTFAQIGSNFEIMAGADPAMEMLIARQVPCQFGQGETLYAQAHYNGGVGDGVTITGNRYPLAAVKIVAPAGGMDVILNRDSSNLWQAAPGMTFSNRPWTYAITDINGRTVTTMPLMGLNMAEPTGVQNPACQ
jgi:hypothetical protein